MARSTRKGQKGSARTVTLEAWGVVAMVLLTWWLLSSGTLERLLEASKSLGQFASLVAGLMYSVFATVPLSVGAFLSLAHTTPAWQIALWGAIGAMVADLLLVDGVRSPLMNALADGVFGKDNIHAIGRRVARGPYRWISAIFGAILIAVPLPTDEIGISFMGVSHLRNWQLVPIVFVADFIGIYLLVSAASALL